MRYINKKDNEPEGFLQWKRDKAEELERLYQNASVTTKKVWRLLDRQRGAYNKKQLRGHLLEEQGHICCYCGRRLTSHPSNSVIDHLFPKSKYIRRTYDYDNLVLSCVGGSRHLVHILREGETLLSISEDYAIPVSDIEEINVTENQLEILRETYDLDKLEVGDRLIIMMKIKGPHQHCDSKKGNHELLIHPLQPDVEHHFSYETYTGKVKETTVEVKDVVRKLGLNSNAYLVQQRKRTIDDAYGKIQELMNLFGQDLEAFKKAQQKILQLYERPDPKTGKLPAFSFVTATIMRKG